MLYFSAEKQPSINIEFFNSIGTQRSFAGWCMNDSEVTFAVFNAALIAQREECFWASDEGHLKS
jgi:hypothetical protein